MQAVYSPEHVAAMATAVTFINTEAGRRKIQKKQIHKQRRAFHRRTYKDILLIYSHLQNKAQERKNHVLGNCWLKLPALAKHNDNHLPELPTNRRSWYRWRCSLWKLTGRFHEGLRGGKRYVLPTSQNPSHWNPSWWGGVCASRKDPESERWARDNPQTDPITIKPEPRGGAVLLGSLTLLLPTQAPLSNKASSLSAPVSLVTIHFWVLDKRPLSGPGRGASETLQPTYQDLN